MSVYARQVTNTTCALDIGDWLTPQDALALKEHGLCTFWCLHKIEVRFRDCRTRAGYRIEKIPNLIRKTISVPPPVGILDAFRRLKEEREIAARILAKK